MSTATTAGPPPPALSIANSRRSDLRKRILRDLEAVQRSVININPNCGPDEYVRQARQQQDAVSHLEARLAACDGLEGWDLVEFFHVT